MEFFYVAEGECWNSGYGVYLTAASRTTGVAGKYQASLEDARRRW
jgi:hypothetical protein